MQKIEVDPYYSDLQDVLSLERIYEAGFFEDSWPENSIRPNVEMVHCTPIHLIHKNLKNAKKPCVLISTGAFCPVHQGHFEMLEHAKTTLESHGYDVLSGFLSPGHDEYIRSKTGNQAIPIWERLKIIEDKCPDWIFPEPWEAMYCQIAVNFTVVVNRLENYLFHVFKQEIPVFFVCGADNARFSLTFLKKGHCVVVGRPGSELAFEKYQTELKNHERIYFVQAFSNASSTEIRKKSGYYENIKKNLYLRIGNADNREQKIKEILKQYFTEIQIVNIEDQKKTTQKLFQNNDNILSLDAFLPTKNLNLEVSRLYDMGGCRKIGFTHRPGSETIEIQINKIRDHHEIVLFDDDIYTGGTMKFAEEQLSLKDIKCSGFLSLHHTISGEEVLDIRDFMIDGIYNGLVVKFLDEIFRVPYILPFVCPWQRASISSPIIFSIEIWKINKQYFLKNPVTCSDFPTYYPLFRLYDISLESQMSDFCEYFIQLLNQFAYD